jgi:hypothetical protein
MTKVGALNLDECGCFVVSNYINDCSGLSIGNKFLTQLSNAFNNLNLTDMETCYKLIRSDIAKGLDLKERRFGFEPEVTAKLARVKDVRIYEVGISYYGRTYAEGKKIGWRDGFRAIWCIVKYGL